MQNLLIITFVQDQFVLMLGSSYVARIDHLFGSRSSRIAASTIRNSLISPTSSSRTLGSIPKASQIDSFQSALNNIRRLTQHLLQIHLQGGPKTRPLHKATTFQCSRSLKRLHDFWQTSAALCSEHIAITPFNLTKCIKVTPPGESQQPGFRFRQLLRALRHKMLSSSSEGRRQDRSRPRSAWTAANIVHVEDLHHDMQRGVAESLARVRHQWTVSSSGMRFATERRTRETYL